MILLSHVVKWTKAVPFAGDCYEFGVYKGESLFETVEEFAKHGIKVNNFYGFDSFEGLPQEADGKEIPPEWEAGQLDARNSYEDIMREAAKHGNVRIAKGFFSDVLTSVFVNGFNLRKAMFVNIDCDLYISAYQALDALFSHGLIACGTVIHYDDWGGTKEFEGGESLAHIEIAAKYDVDFEEVASYKNGIHAQKLFVVRSIGADK